MNSTGGDYDIKPVHPAPFSLNLGTWSQYPVIAPLKNSCSSCILKSRGVGEITTDNDRMCRHCGKHFRPKNRIQHFCKDGCRTYFHRKKREALVPAMLAAYGMGYDHALDVLEKSGITRVIQAINQMGYIYDGKAWAMDPQKLGGDHA